MNLVEYLTLNRIRPKDVKLALGYTWPTVKKRTEHPNELTVVDILNIAEAYNLNPEDIFRASAESVKRAGR